MSINKIPQRQVKSIRQEFTSLEAQLAHVESRTRVRASINYDTKTQWDLGTTKTNIDTSTTLDQIQLTNTNGVYSTSGTFISYVLDAGGLNVAPESFTYTHTKPANTSIVYYTRSGNYPTPDETWSAWQTVNTEGVIASANARYFQVKIELATTNTAATPLISSFSVYVWGGVGSQELFNARGGYPSLADRLDNQGNVYSLKVIPGEDDTDITIGKVVTDGTILQVYLNGQLVNEGEYDEDAYTIISGTVVRFNSPLSNQDVVVLRIAGAGAGVVTVKEARIVDEMPTTADHITFTLQREPVPGKEEVYIGGIKMLEGAGNDYIVSGNNIIFNYTTPQPDTDELYHPRVTYLYVT